MGRGTRPTICLALLIDGFLDGLNPFDRWVSIPDIGPVFGNTADYAVYKTAGTVLGIGTGIAISMFGPGLVSCGTLPHKILFGWEIAGAVGGVAGSVSNIVENGSVGVMDVLGLAGGVMSIVGIGRLMNKCFVGDTLVIYGREDVFMADAILTVADRADQWNTIGLILGGGLLLAGGLGCSLEARREDKKKQFPAPDRQRPASERVFADDDLLECPDPCGKVGELEDILTALLESPDVGLHAGRGDFLPAPALEAVFAADDLFDDREPTFEKLPSPRPTERHGSRPRPGGRPRLRHVMPLSGRTDRQAVVDNPAQIGHTAIQPEPLTMTAPIQHEPPAAVADACPGGGSRGRRRAGKALVYGLLLLAGFCCLAFSSPRSWWQPPPTPAVATAADVSRQVEHTQPRLLARPIRDVRPGQRVLAENPELEGVVVEPLEIEPDQWRLIRLKMPKPDGGTLAIELLRPVLWLQLAACETLLEDTPADNEAIDALLERIEDEAGLHGVLLGSTIELDLEELGAAGPAEVVEIATCPQLEEGEGRIVTGTFSHAAANVIDVHVSGLAEPIGTTDTHPFWSEDRQAFVPAGELRIGERLRTLADSMACVASITRRATTQRVYNFEVNGFHTYRVTSNGVLVHNVCAGNHHFFPRSLGSKTPYGHKSLTQLSSQAHTAIHDAMRSFLRGTTKVVNGRTFDMLPRAGNAGRLVQLHFTRQERLRALVKFYKHHEGGEYLGALLRELKEATRHGWVR